MKILFSILVLLLTVKECDQKKTTLADSSKTKLVEKMEAKQQQEEPIIQYTASTRGFFEEITLKNESMSVNKVRGLEDDSFKPISDDVWSDIMVKLNKIDITNISKLKPPSTDRYVDAKAMATLKIIYQDTVYVSSQFDHGNPPEELKPLCDAILKLSEEKKE